MHRPRPVHSDMPKTPEETANIPSDGPDPAFGVVTQGQYRPRCAKCGSEFCECYERGGEGYY